VGRGSCRLGGQAPRGEHAIDAVFDRHRHLHNRRTDELAGHLGDLCATIDEVSWNARHWQHQTDGAGIYNRSGRRGIAPAEEQMVQLRRQVEVLEDEYFALNGEG
jgi:hypothetical protein